MFVFFFDNVSNAIILFFYFSSVISRLVHSNVVRACTVMLSDWEHITTRALKSAVTILHRIAVGCKMPTMLYQVSIYIFFLMCNLGCSFILEK